MLVHKGAPLEWPPPEMHYAGHAFAYTPEGTWKTEKITENNHRSKTEESKDLIGRGVSQI
jgi:hypothetical protein